MCVVCFHDSTMLLHVRCILCTRKSLFFGIIQHVSKLTCCCEGCWDGRFCREVRGCLTCCRGLLDDPDVEDCTCTMYN